MHYKYRYVRERLEDVEIAMRRLVPDPGGLSSAGLTANWSSIGGRSGKTTDLTSMLATIEAAMSDGARITRQWTDLVCDVYVALCDDAGKSAFRQKHDAVLAFVLYAKIFDGRKQSEIEDPEDAFGREMNRMTVSRYYAEVVNLCAKLAESRGMIP